MHDCPVCFFPVETGRTVCPKCESNLGMLMEMDGLPDIMLGWAETCRESDDIEEARFWTKLARGMSVDGPEKLDPATIDPDEPGPDNLAGDGAPEPSGDAVDNSNVDMGSGASLGKKGFSRIVSHIQPILGFGQKAKPGAKEDDHAGDGDH